MRSADHVAPAHRPRPVYRAADVPANADNVYRGILSALLLGPFTPGRLARWMDVAPGRVARAVDELTVRVPNLAEDSAGRVMLLAPCGRRWIGGR